MPLPNYKLFISLKLKEPCRKGLLGQLLNMSYKRLVLVRRDVIRRMVQNKTELAKLQQENIL